MQIKTKTRKSGLWQLWKLLFPDANLERMYLAFNRTIYLPPDVTECPQSMFVHEGVHLRQQGYSLLGALIWWVKYITNKDFRYEQELEAYRTQVKWFNDTHKTATFQQQYQYRMAVAEVLASPMYGNITTTSEAFKALGEISYQKELEVVRRHKPRREVETKKTSSES